MRPVAPQEPTTPLATTTSIRVARNTAVNAARPVVNLAVGIAMTPFLLHQIGATSYGIYVLAASFSAGAGYLSLGEVGLQGAVIRFVARHDALGQRDLVARVVGTAMTILLAIGLVGATLLTLFALYGLGIFNVAADDRSAARFVFLILAAQVVAEFSVLALLGYLEGLQRFFTITMLGLTQLGVYVALVVPLVLAGAGVRGVAVAAATATFVHLIAALTTVRLQAGKLSPRPGIDRRILPELGAYSWRLMVIRLTSVGYDQMDKLIIAITLSPFALAVYQIANNVHAMARYALSFGSSALTPVASALEADADNVRLRSLLIRGTRLTVALALPVTISVILLAQPLIEGWVGDGYPAAVGAAQLFVVYILFTSVTTAGVIMLLGMGRMEGLLALGLFSMLVNLAASLALVGPFGIKGVIAGTTIGYSIILGPYLHLILRQFELTLREFTREALARPVAVACVHATLLGVAVVAREPGSLLETFAYGAAAFVLYVVLYVRYAADEPDRVVLRGLLPRRSPA